jgi:dihydrolipoamide dehydrogenase
MRKVDVIILGAGSGGLSARREVAKKTQNYLVVDGGKLGTTCARVGCMPSKVLIQVANDFYRRTAFTQEGILGHENLSVDSRTVMKHVRSLRDRFVRGVTGSMESWTGEKLIKGYGKFKSKNVIEVNGESIEGEKIVIATGSTPTVPEMFNEFSEYLITTDEFFEMEKLPESMAVIGLGVIGLELGQALHRLGVNVTGIARRKSISGISDPKLKDYVLDKFSKEMNLSFDGVTALSKVDGGIKITTGDKEVIVEKILLTPGRTPNLKNLKLDVLELEYNKYGIPLYNNETFQLNQYPHIFLAGDITGENQILHEASDEGKIAGHNCVNDTKEFITRSPLLVTFCDPNIAFVGLKYEELIENKINFEIGEVCFEGQGRSIVKLKEIGLLRVYGDKQTGEILGAELFAPEGEHLAHLLSWVISQKLTVNKVLSFPFYHPVIEEGLRTALRDLRDKVDEVAPVLETYLK